MYIQKAFQLPGKANLVLVLQEDEVQTTQNLDAQEQSYIREHYDSKSRNTFFFNKLSHFLYVQVTEGEVSDNKKEFMRKQGVDAADFFSQQKQSSAIIVAREVADELVLSFAEGFALTAYQFVKHKQKDESRTVFNELDIISEKISEQQIQQLQNIVHASYETRNLVNEPENVLNALAFARHMEAVCKQAGADVQVFEKEKIKQLGMEALLTVNKGSKSQPTFTRIEWKPDDARNSKPLVLVGKGLVFDTGGINIKPTQGLETMKSDMAGGAAVFGTLYALALNKVPVHVIGLIPATDNRPGEEAMLPGDIIKLGNGKTVEIINTDAEGRLILADALLYAQSLDPELVIDIATLTGSATVAIGRFGIPAMHQDAESHMQQLKESGQRTWERIAELPFWEEYGEDMISDIADLRNIGKGKGAGTITAGKFLAHFINYPWIHLDIAGVAFMDGRQSYLGKGATAYGVRLLYDFISQKFHHDS